MVAPAILRPVLRSFHTVHSDRGKQRGFTYLGLLFAVAAMGILLAAAAGVWETTARRERETELLFIGNEFRNAIGSYYSHTPDAAKQYPLTLEDLLQDTRSPVPYRHLRKLYRDPFTHNTKWGLVRAGGRIIGVYSLHNGKPLRTHFSGRDKAFEGLAQYSEWQFVDDGMGHKPETGAASNATPDGKPVVLQPPP